MTPTTRRGWQAVRQICSPIVRAKRVAQREAAEAHQDAIWKLNAPPLFAWRLNSTEAQVEDADAQHRKSQSATGKSATTIFGLQKEFLMSSILPFPAPARVAQIDPVRCGIRHANFEPPEYLLDGISAAAIPAPR